MIKIMRFSVFSSSVSSHDLRFNYWSVLILPPVAVVDKGINLKNRKLFGIPGLAPTRRELIERIMETRTVITTIDHRWGLKFHLGSLSLGNGA